MSETEQKINRILEVLLKIEEKIDRFLESTKEAGEREFRGKEEVKSALSYTDPLTIKTEYWRQ
nr:hypothetical protein [Candidatus Baldrarchaeota archaeon]